MTDARLARVTVAARHHILAEHGPGTGVPGKSEFPPSGDAAKIVDAVRAVQRSPAAHRTVSGDKLTIEGLVDGVWLRVHERTYPDGSREVWTAYPVKGTGVVYNRRDGRREWRPTDRRGPERRTR